MDMYDICDLLTKLGDKLVPNLKLKFYIDPKNYFVSFARLKSGGCVAFDYKEIRSKQTVQPKVFYNFFLERCYKSIIENMILESEIITKIRQRKAKILLGENYEP